MNGRRIAVLAGLALATFAASGCAPFGGTEGQLGHGEFFYQCAGDGDIACDANKDQLDVEITSTNGAKLPRGIAVGAPFKLTFQGNHDLNVADTTLISASPRLAPESDLGFAIEKPVTVSFLAQRSGGRISDFIDITAEEVDTIGAFHDGVPVTKLSLASGQSHGIGAYARGASGTPLSGALIWGWSSSDSNVVAVAPDYEGSTANEIFVHAAGPGFATLTIRTNGKSLALPVTVD
jgi:hypothetical protein